MILMHKQRGSTLLVALVMLVLLTLIALSAMNATTNSIQVVGNAQFREEAVAAGQKAIETLISTSLFKSVAATTTQSIDINGDGSNDYLVTFNPAPKCISFVAARPADANLPKICSSSVGTTCYWTVWDVTALVTDPNGSGATVAVHQGIKTIAGLNDAVTYCGI
jgi:type II secretory pathway pseudopilin PulG